MTDLELDSVHAHATPDEIADLTVAALRDGSSGLQALLDELSSPIYVTDADGWVTFFNRACVDFVGRTPVPGQDRWCVSWRLYTESGAFLPHENCPMAEAIQQRRRIRGVVAVAERPDGSRVMFAPHPSPVTDADGTLIGAVNILIDVTDHRQAAALQAQALRCRRLAQSVTDLRTVETLSDMALEYEEKARRLFR
ncbi:PAS domain-containing protein [Sphingosinicella sp. CPCC 101087]|uniref:PAS domain-containing protein n=1 Tax=Sphingosinicella sp. CPCC 101087 TaxID=2497754 RepID=UPI0013E9CB04|nr:PAS domain-containing protein [Sphingosinicella sp. CPCC 101087]